MERTVNSELFFINMRLGFIILEIGVEALEEQCLKVLKENCLI